MGGREGNQRKAMHRSLQGAEARPDTHLQPLRGVGRVALCCPGVDLAPIVQPPKEGEPVEHRQPPRLVAAGGCDLPVGDAAVLQAQGFRASCWQRQPSLYLPVGAQIREGKEREEYGS